MKSSVPSAAASKFEAEDDDDVPAAPAAPPARAMRMFTPPAPRKAAAQSSPRSSFDDADETISDIDPKESEVAKEESGVGMNL